MDLSKQPSAFRAGLLVALAFLFTACAVGPAGQGGTAESSQRPPQKKRITAALLRADLADINDQQANRITEFLRAGLARTDTFGVVHPQLAEAVPSIQNGLWEVFPDGRMQTTWRIRPDAAWHDGSPVTTADFVFGMTVGQDREVAPSISVNFQDIEAIEAPDDRTVVVRWRQPNIEADRFVGDGERLLPRHLLERSYKEDKASFLQLPYWSREYVGAGPFRLREWAHSSHVAMEAFDRYVLGRPKIDEVEVKFIADATTVVANLLAGTVDLTLGLALAPDEAANLKSYWREGSILTSPYFASSVGIVPQFLNPSPTIVTNLEFRRALLHAIDRQEMVDSIMAGLSGVAHSYVAVPYLDQIQDQLVRYEYNPQTTAQVMQSLGYQRGPNGIYQNAQGNRLGFELRALQEEAERVKSAVATNDAWQRAGFDVQFSMLSPQSADREHMATTPAFSVRGISGGDGGIRTRLHSSAAPLPETRFAGNNLGRYMSPELDGLIDGYFQTIPVNERIQRGGRVLHHVTENVVGMGLFFNVDGSAINNRLLNITPSTHFARGWDAHLWDIR